jgi:hypothetical protein
MLEAPCKNCPKKGCGIYHDICPDYQEFKKESKKINEERYERGKFEDDYRAVTVERALRMKKYRTRHKQR